MPQAGNGQRHSLVRKRDVAVDLHRGLRASAVVVRGRLMAGCDTSKYAEEYRGMRQTESRSAVLSTSRTGISEARSGLVQEGHLVYLQVSRDLAEASLLPTLLQKRSSFQSLADICTDRCLSVVLFASQRLRRRRSWLLEASSQKHHPS